MKRVEVRVANRLGLHARAAARFVHVADLFTSRITVSNGTSRVDGKSILGLLTLAASKGVVLELTAEGDDEDRAVEALRDLVRGRFGEAG